MLNRLDDDDNCEGRLTSYKVSGLTVSICTLTPNPPFPVPVPQSAPHIVGERSPSSQDTIRVRDLLLLAHVADGAQWPSSTSAPVRQPVRVSVSVPYDLRPAAEADDVSKSINYGSLSKCILASVEGRGQNRPPSARQFRGLEQLSGHVFATCFDAFPEIQRMTLDVVKARALPYADGVRVLSSRARDGSRLASERFSIQRLACNLIVGLNPCEREDKQLVCFDVDVSTHHHPSSPAHPQNESETLEPENDNAFDFRGLAKDICQVRAFRSPQGPCAPSTGKD